MIFHLPCPHSFLCAFRFIRNATYFFNLMCEAIELM